MSELAPPSFVNVEVRCPFCRKAREIKVPADGYWKWIRAKEGMLIQYALPDLSDSDREGLLTGICDDCFPKEPEE